MMAMALPIGCTHMHLYIAHPFLVANTQVDMTKVGPCITIMLPSRDDLNGYSIRGKLLAFSPELLLPYIVQ
jgi:hypothetical protein